MNRNTLSRLFSRCAAPVLLATAAAVQATTLAPGDLWFTGLARESAYGGWSFVSFVDIAAGTQISFSDLSLQANGSFKTSVQKENTWVWTATSALAAGTQVVVYSGSYSLATSAVTGSSSGQGARVVSTGTLTALPTADNAAYQFDFASSGEVLYALQGGSFIAAINNYPAPPASSSDNPLASGLALIQNINYTAAHGGTGDGVIQRTEWYRGPTQGLTAAQYKAAILDMANWDKDTSTSALKSLALLQGTGQELVTGGEAVGRGAGNFQIVAAPVPEPGGAALGLAGLSLLGLLARRRMRRARS